MIVTDTMRMEVNGKPSMLVKVDGEFPKTKYEYVIINGHKLKESYMSGKHENVMAFEDYFGDLTGSEVTFE